MGTISLYQEEKQQAALSRELSEFLVAFSIAAHRFAMYPPEHPSLLPAVENVISDLAGLLRHRSVLTLGIAQRQLVIDNVATDERHPVLSDLARRLHSHQLGAVAFAQGLTLDELSNFLAAVAEEPERGGEPLGLIPEAIRPTWDHIVVQPIGYDQLVFAGEAGGSRSGQLWLQLARAAIGESVDDENLPGIAALAKIFQERRNDTEYDRVIVGYLLQLASELKGAAGAEADEIRKRMSELIRELDEATLQRMIRLGAGKADRKRLVLDANRGGLAVDSVIKVLQAAATVEGQSISTSLTRLLSKLSIHAEQGAKDLRIEAEHALRDNIDQLMADWELDDPNPDAYTQILDRMARASLLFESDSQGDGVPGAERIIQMALEVDAFGPTVQKAVSDLLDEGMMARILQLVDAAPRGSQVAERLRGHLMTPVQLRRLLAGDDVDEESLRLLVERIGEKAVDPLFQFLTESDSRAIRRKIFDVLVSMGIGLDTVVAMAVERTRDERWYVKRNMLALLQKVEKLPDDFSPLPLLQHHDARVRREAFPLAIRLPAARDRALSVALGDEDERVVRMALLELQESLPETLVPVVVNRILGTQAFPTLRSLAVRSLAHTRSPLALETLLGICAAGKSLFGKLKLAPKSPELLAAVGILAKRWQGDSRAKSILAIAEKSQDIQIVNAARSGGPLS